MGLVWQHDQPSRPTIAADRFVEKLGLNGRCAGVGVFFSMDNEERMLEFVRVEEGRNFEVSVRRFPDGAALILKAEGSEG